MKTRSYLLALFGAASLSVCQAQNKITLQHNGQFTYYDQDSLQVALDDAQDGDVVLLPGGTFDGSYTLDRSVQLIGAGYDPDSTSATTSSVIVGNLYLNAGASGSIISGINFTSNVYAHNQTYPLIENLIVHRCYIQGDLGHDGFFGFSDNSSNILISECVVWDIDMNDARNVTVRNSIITQNVSYVRNGNIEFNVFLGGHSKSILSCGGCSVRGNVFLGNQTIIEGLATSFSHASNNCFVDSDPLFDLATSYNNLSGIPSNQLATLYDDVVFEFTDDYRLPLGSPALGAGPNDHDCGVYGGPSPRKEGGVPLKPHIQDQFIGTATGLDGDLPVQIKVAAQDH